MLTPQADSVPARDRERRPAGAACRPVRVLIADDSAPLRCALRAYLEHGASVEVVGEAGDGVEAVARAVALRPDVVLMDSRMPLLSGAEATREVLRLTPGCRVLGLSAGGDPREAAAVLRAGAAAYLDKNAALTSLVDTIMAVHSGVGRVSPSAASRAEPGAWTGNA